MSFVFSEVYVIVKSEVPFQLDPKKCLVNDSGKERRGGGNFERKVSPECLKFHLKNLF